MKIAHFVSTFPPYHGGMGKVAEEHAKILSDLNHDVTVFTPLYGTLRYDTKYPFQVERIRPLFKFGNAAFVPQFAKKVDPFDVVHLHYPFFGGAEMLNGVMNSRLEKKRFIITYHMDTVGVGFQAIIFAWYKKNIMPSIIENAHMVTVSSFDYLKNSDIKEIYEKKPELFVELPFSVDLDRFTPGVKDNKLLQKAGIHPEEKVILFVGGLDKAHYFKGIDYLIRAVEILIKKKKAIKLVIGGCGELVQTYKILTKNLGIKENVIFLGSISEQDLPKWYRSSDLFVLPSVDRSEAFGIVLLEAMSSGTAIVTSDIAGVRSVVKSGKNGLLARPKDEKDLSQKIDIILSQPELVHKLGLEGRRLAEEKYDRKIIGKKLVNIYEDRADQ